MEETEKGSVKRIIFTILFVIIVAVLLVFALTSDIFRVEEIVVKNNVNIEAEKIKEQSGIVVGKNIFLQRYLKAAITLKENTRIGEVKVYPVFPNKIEIYIEERNENYQISHENGYYIIDRNGYILRKSDELQKIIMIIGIDTKDFDKKYRINDEDLEVLEKINGLKEVLDYYGLTEKVTSIEKKEKEFVIDLKEEKKKIRIALDLSNLRSQISISKHIIETEKGKEGEIFNDKNQKRSYMVFREKI